MLLVIQFFWLSDALRYTIGGFKCSEDALKSVVELPNEVTGLDDICSNLTISIKDKDSTSTEDKGAKISVEHSHVPLPGAGVSLYDADVISLLVTLNTVLSSSSLTQRLNSACGVSFLLASLKVENEVVGFDVLALKKECLDEPNLRLNVKLSTDKPQKIKLIQGMSNPLEALGVEGITVETTGNVNELSPRWWYDTPEVVAFFLPLTEIACK